ncbi:MAG: YcaO-like family protein [Candidatus Sungbacteria bacterium]|nr:YcaO-like family protein [Candidatus Sungbacteria bacterium]
MPSEKTPEDFGFHEVSTVSIEKHYGPPEIGDEWRKLLHVIRSQDISLDMREENMFPSNVPLFNFFAGFHHARTDGHIPPPGIARGVSSDRSEALSKAFGEFLERYPLLLYRKEDLLLASPRQLRDKGHAHLDPRTIAGFNDEQCTWFPNRSFSENSVFGWVSGASAMRRGKVLVPAQLVFWNYCKDYDSYLEPHIRGVNTNGAGGFFTEEGALLSGIYELVQRDSFLIYWLNNKAPPRIDASATANHDLKKLLEASEREGLAVTFLDTTSDLGIPSVACATVTENKDEPHIVYGGGCDFNAEAALLRALEECLGVRYWVKRYAPAYHLPPDYVPFRTTGIVQANRLGFWKHFRGPGALTFFSGPQISLTEFQKRARKFASKREELRGLVRIFKARGSEYEIFFYRAEHPALTRLGYESSRVIIPALVPLYLREEHATLGAKRLQDAPFRMGFQPSRAPNPLPHPFP